LVVAQFLPVFQRADDFADRHLDDALATEGWSIG
jgi:hypothetical protein